MSTPDGLLGLVLGRLREQLLRQGPLALRVELLGLVGDRALVDVLVPVVEHLESEQRRLADELPQDLVGRPPDPPCLAVAQGPPEVHIALSARATPPSRP